MKTKRIIALAIALVMCLPSIAFANSQTVNGNGALVSTNPNESVKAAISKNLQMPIGTPTPNTVFSFHAKGISVNGNTSKEIVDDMPDLSKNLTVAFSSDDRREPNADTNVISIVKETKNIFEDVVFDEPGIYIYEITEVQATSNGIENNKPYEQVTFSKAVYTMRVYVAWNSDRSATIIYGVGTYVSAPDISGEQGVDKKIDATPGEDSDKYDYSQLIFTNNYIKTNAPIDPERPDPVNESTLYISKLVTGNMGSLTQYFELEIELKVPDIMGERPQLYRAYIVEGDKVIHPRDNVMTGAMLGVDEGGTFISVPANGAIKFKLKDDQRLVFVDTPIGTSYTAKEKIEEDYIQTVQVTTNAIAGGIISREGDNPLLSTGPQFVGDKLNRAVFTANRESAAPMGIDVNNLPFIGLILLTMGALVGFVLVKSRRRKYETGQ